MKQMKQKFCKNNPKIVKYFDKLQKSELFLQQKNIYDSHSDKLQFLKFGSMILSELERVFGKEITIYPSSQPKSNQLDLFLEYLQIKCANNQY